MRTEVSRKESLPKNAKTKAKEVIAGQKHSQLRWQDGDGVRCHQRWQVTHSRQRSSRVAGKDGKSKAEKSRHFSIAQMRKMTAPIVRVRNEVDT